MGRRGTDGFRKLEIAQIEAKRKKKEIPLRKKSSTFSCGILLTPVMKSVRKSI